RCPLLLTASAPPATSPLSLHDALPIFVRTGGFGRAQQRRQQHRCECRAQASQRHVDRLETSQPRCEAREGGLLRRTFAIVCPVGDRKSTRLNSSHVKISYAVFCLKKKK